MRQYDKEKLRANAIKIVAESELPCSIDFVRHNLGTTWPTARAILFALSLEGKLSALRTTGGWVFCSNDDDAFKPQSKRARGCKSGVGK